MQVRLLPRARRRSFVTPPLTVSEEVEAAITERISTRVRAMILTDSGLVFNPDDPIGSDVLVFTETALLADPSQPFTRRFADGVPDHWTVRSSATATVPADFARRRRVTPDLDKLACVTPTEGGPGGDVPYLWSAAFVIDGTTASLGRDLRLRGTAAVVTGPGSHRNLGVAWAVATPPDLTGKVVLRAPVHGCGANPPGSPWQMKAPQ